MKSGKKKRRAPAAEGLSRLNRRLLNRAGRGFPGRKRVEGCLEILYTEKNVQEKTEEFYLEKHLLLLKIFAAGILDVCRSRTGGRRKRAFTGWSFSSKAGGGVHKGAGADRAGKRADRNAGSHGRTA